MHSSSSKLGHPVLLYRSIISAALFGLILMSLGDGWSGKRHAAMSLRIVFPVSSVTIGGSPPWLGRSNTHLVKPVHQPAQEISIVQGFCGKL
jgi:hypothetical protein